MKEKEMSQQRPGRFQVGLIMGLLICGVGFADVGFADDGSAAQASDETPILKYLYEWGEPGTGTAQFRALRGITAYDRPESDGRTLIVVADGGRDLLRSYTWNMMFIDKWGSTGSEPGQFREPRGLAIDGEGHLWVVDSRNHRVQRTVIGTKSFLDQPGRPIQSFGSRGSGEGQFETPTGIGVDVEGMIYVVDTENHRIQKFDPQGKFVLAWGTLGRGDDNLDRPTKIAFDSKGQVYVSDTGNHRVQIFDKNGKYRRSVGQIGSRPGYFAEPKGLALDAEDNLYVVDRRNHRLQKFDARGNVLGMIGKQGPGEGEFSFPEDLAIDSSGRLYVTDAMNGRIQVFKP